MFSWVSLNTDNKDPAHPNLCCVACWHDLWLCHF